MKPKEPIIINAKFLGRTLTGVDRFAYETLNALDRLIDENANEVFGMEFGLAVPANCNMDTPFEHIPILYRGVTKGLIWEQIELPLVTFGKRLINLCNAAPIIKREQMVVIHDATPSKIPASYSYSFRCWYQFMIPIIGRWARQIFTVSEFSKKEISDAYHVRLEKIGVLSESGEHILRFDSDDAILKKYQLYEKPYLFAVGSMAPHKNFKLLFDAISDINDPQFNVVIAGGTNPLVFAKPDSPIPEFVKHVGYVTDNELKALMTHAACFVFPSIYEGFGLPVAEAMSLGCPVLSSNAASLPEVGKDAVLYFSPDSVSQLSNLICKLMQSDILMASLRKKGLDRSLELTWRKTALSIVSSQNCGYLSK